MRKGFIPKREMSPNVSIRASDTGQRYEALLRISEALSACREPEDLTKILSEELGEFLDFFQFYIIVYKENSTDVEWAVVGSEKSLVSAYADVPVQERPSWRAYATQEPFHIADWDGDERVPPRLKEGIVAQGLKDRAACFCAPHHTASALGTLGMSGPPGSAYSSEDIGFLRLIGRVVAFAIDDNFNLRQAEAAKRDLQRHNERLQRNRLTDYWRGVLASSQSGEIEARLRRFDGLYRWFLFRATPSLDNNGKVVKWYGTNTDIEERKKAEQAVAVRNTRLQLLLKLTKQITSNLELRELLRAISASIREVMDCDAVHISLADPASGKFRLYALDFPEGKGFVKEEMLIESVGACKRALETRQPTTRNTANPEEFPPDLYKLMVAEGLKTQGVIPLVSRGQVVGFLTINRSTDDAFLPDEIGFLKEASGQIAIAIENCLAFSEISELKEKLAQEKLYLEEEIRGDMNFEQIVGNSPALKHVLQLVETVAPSDSTVLLLGETGTGKELIARRFTIAAVANTAPS